MSGQEPLDIVPFKEVAKEIGREKGFEPTSFYIRALSQIKASEEFEKAGVWRKGGRWYAIKQKLVNYLSRYEANPDKQFEELDPLWTFEDFKEKTGTFSMAEFATRFGRGSGYLDVSYDQLIPTTKKARETRANRGIVQLNGRWAVLMPKFFDYLKENGFLVEYNMRRGG